MFALLLDAICTKSSKRFRKLHFLMSGKVMTLRYLVKLYGLQTLRKQSNLGALNHLGTLQDHQETKISDALAFVG